MTSPFSVEYPPPIAFLPAGHPPSPRRDAAAVDPHPGTDDELVPADAGGRRPGPARLERRSPLAPGSPFRPGGAVGALRARVALRPLLPGRELAGRKSAAVRVPSFTFAP